MRESLGDRIFSYMTYIILTIIAFATAFPMYYVLAVSFTDPNTYLTSDFVLFPKKVSLESYQYLLGTSAFPRATGISALVTLLGTPIELAVTSSIAYALSRKRLVGRKALTMGILFTMLFSAGFIPNFLLIKNLGLMNSIWALILPVASSGWNVILMRSFFESIPESLEEAAVIDGCNDIAVWLKIMLPLSLPALAAFGLFAAVALWNTYMAGLFYMTDYKKYPLQVLLRNMLNQPVMESENASIPPPKETLKMAAVVITIAPIVMVYPFLQKHFAKGVMLGSVKG